MSDEEAWRNSEDPNLMFGTMERLGLANNRKARLFGCACYGVFLNSIESPSLKRLIRLAEKRADRKINQSTLLQKVAALRHRIVYMGVDQIFREEIPHLVERTVSPSQFVRHISTISLPEQSDDLSSVNIHVIQANFVRCIFGNPFRPVTFSPIWNTSTVLALADAIYEDRAWDRMPILADAIEEAGCEEVAILDHCRGPGPHARGCSVVDGVLGKT